MQRLLSIFLAILAFNSVTRAADELLKQIQTLPLDHLEGRIDHMSSPA
jgi:hypothetical protein